MWTTQNHTVKSMWGADIDAYNYAMSIEAQ